MTATTERTYPGSPARIHASPAERDAILRESAKLLDWLTAHPEAPLPKWGHDWVISCRDAAEVRRAAAELGIEAEDRPSLTRATMRFGPVAYVLTAAKGATS